MKIIMEIIPETGSAVNVINPQQSMKMETVNPVAAQPSVVTTFDGGAFAAFKATENVDVNKGYQGYDAGMFDLPAVTNPAGYNENQPGLYTYDPLNVLNGGKMKFHVN